MKVRELEGFPKKVDPMRHFKGKKFLLLSRVDKAYNQALDEAGDLDLPQQKENDTHDECLICHKPLSIYSSTLLCPECTVKWNKFSAQPKEPTKANEGIKDEVH